VTTGQREFPMVHGTLGDKPDELISRARHSISLAMRFRLAS